MNERTILDFLALQNPWWSDRLNFPFNRIKSFKRSDYFYLAQQAKITPECFVVVGPRGVGKSTVLRELIRGLLGFSDAASEENKEDSAEQLKLDSRRILYASFEEPNLQKIPILELLQIYARYILREDVSKLSAPIYVFFDEIQDIVWGDQIKIIQDLQYPIKIMISGSSSTAMLDEAAKAVRRVRIYSMHPLKFADYVRYKIPVDDAENFKKAIKFIKDSRQEIVEGFRQKNPKKIYDKLLQIYTELKKWDTQIQICFEEYLIKGGYPGLFGIQDYLQASGKLSQQFWLGFHKDLVQAKGIGDPAGMKRLSEYIASISSCETNYTSLMDNSQTGANTDILKKYLYHLETAFLIKQSNRFKGNPSKRSSTFKIYMTDIAIRNMVRGLMNELLLKNQQECGYVIESLIFDHLIRLNYKFTGGAEMYYWKDPKNDKEVDIILDFKSFVLPVEVKKSDEPSVQDVQGLTAFCEGKTPGLVSCGKKLALEGNIIFLPHWLLSMIC